MAWTDFPFQLAVVLIVLWSVAVASDNQEE